MLRLVTVCRPAKTFIFLLWASRRLYCHNNNNNDNNNNDSDNDNDNDNNNSRALAREARQRRTMGKKMK